MPARPTLPASHPGRHLAAVWACALTLVAAPLRAAPEPAGSGHPLLKGCEPALPEACTEALELLALRQLAGGVQRDGAQLHFAKGTPAQLDDSEADGRHRLLGALGDSGLLLVLRQRSGQPPEFLLQGPGALNRPLPDAPWPAPGGRLMALASAARSGQPARLWLLGRVGAQWRVLEQLEGRPGLGFSVLGWRSDGAALRLQWHCADSTATGALQWRDGPYGWDLLPAWPTEACR